ncbi:DeoR/GlpR family DNA-binding transcription regulator [Amnibacterium setariae]|uniref:Lactose phosphotransferase system repressor n=1 Tax=Amnibacterium setariae TaxID=2306585 RepID=A0A3A1TY84_9MICO|nr:DeoR/GlpR family DNA-binding transcription regulator [Amnibacterium setariae]RIX27635.1 DeoR/GlpR transcriptional regulator [Amnibacterium setariae]
MYATERHARIIDELDSAGRVSVAVLSRSLDVTAETIRRDLDVLESAGALRRVHGGAVRRSSVVELNLGEREQRNTPAKRAIARAALDLLVHAAPSAVALDAGTTTRALADLLADHEPADGRLDVVTHGVPLVLRLQDNRALTVHAVGGVVRPETSAAVGAAAVDAFARMRCDLAFLGANGLSAGFGLSTPDEREAAVKTAMLRAARRTVALVDSSKFGEESFVRFADLTELDVLVTDAAPPADLAAALDAAGVEVVIA